MMSRFGKWLPAMLVVAGFALLGLPRSALSVTVEFSAVITTGPDGTGTVVGTIGPTAATYPTFALVTTSGNTGGLTIIGGSHEAGNNSPITGLGEQVLNSNVDSVANTSGAFRSAVVVVSGNNFVGPTNLLDMNLSGRFNTAQGSSITVQWFNDTANGLSTVTAPGGVVTRSIAGVAVGPNPFFYSSPDNNANQFGIGPVLQAFNDPNPFGMSLVFTINFTVGAILQNRGQAEIATPTAIPEPGAMALALSGLPLLGIGVWRHRRRA